jgi:hypothetical protein
VFVGHYAAGFAAKALDRRIPLWALLLAAQLLDFLWSLFILLGVERIAIVPELPGSPIELRFAPFSHSLSSAGIWALVTVMGYNNFVQYRRLEGNALVLGAVVLVHWFFDLLVHRPDLPLYGVRFPVGLGLWRLPGVALALEAVLLAAGVWIYLRAAPHARLRLRVGVPLLAGVLLAIQTAGMFGPPPPNATAVAVGGIVTYIAVVVVAAALEAG